MSKTSEAAIAAAIESVNSGLAIREVSKRHKISRPTLIKHVKQAIAEGTCKPSPACMRNLEIGDRVIRAKKESIVAALATGELISQVAMHHGVKQDYVIAVGVEFGSDRADIIQGAQDRQDKRLKSIIYFLRCGWSVDNVSQRYDASPDEVIKIGQDAGALDLNGALIKGMKIVVGRHIEGQGNEMPSDDKAVDDEGAFRPMSEAAIANLYRLHGRYTSMKLPCDPKPRVWPHRYSERTLTGCSAAMAVL